MPGASLRSALQQVTLPRALIALAMLLVAINVCSAIWDVRSSRAQTERRALTVFSNTTRLLAEQTAASLEAADVVLRDAMREGSAEAVATMVQRLREELMHVSPIASFFVLDSDGALLARTDELPTLDPDPARQSFFAEHRDRLKEGVILTEPFLGGPVQTNWRFILSRRIDGPGRRFGGVVGAVVEVESIDRLYRTIDLGAGGFIALINNDGLIVTRVPDPLFVRGSLLPPSDLSERLGRDEIVQGWTTSPHFDQRMLVSAARVRGFPLRVMSGGLEPFVFAPWREEALQTGLRTLLSSGAMLLLIAFAAWGLARRERALRQSEKRFRAMIEHSSDGVLLTRPGRGGIFYASPSVERITGHRPESLYGREAFDFVHPEQRASLLKQREEMLRTPGRTYTSEILVQRKDGAWQWIENTISNLLHEPAVNAVIMNFRDITERKLAESERARLEQRLRQGEKMQAVGRLAGGIAHDFNNILGGILGYAEMLAEGAAEGTPQKRYAKNVLTAANRAAALVEQILSYSRSQRGRKIPVELDRIVGETVELVRGSLTAGIRLHYSQPAAPLYVVGDPTQLHQVVMNVCTNAIHAMSERGTLSIALEGVQVEAEQVLAHSTLHAGAYAKLSVEDTGTGMDEATLARIFEPFFTTKDVGKGTGLGLSLVYGIVTEAGGAIDVGSTPGRGTRFTIYLPSVDSPALAADESKGPVARGHGERVMIVDDEEALLAVSTEALKRLGYEPMPFPNAAAALAAFEKAPGEVHALIADEIMPGQTGTELAATLRRRRPDLPILLVSGYIGPLMTERALAAGVNEILKKPLQSRELADALARRLSRPALQA